MRKIAEHITALLLFLSICGYWADVNAQQITESPDTVTNNFMPLISYQSDLGFIGGGFYSRTLRNPEVVPYVNRLRTALLASTKGYLKGFVRYEWMDSFKSDIRSKAEVYGQRKLEANFFGIGNSSTFSQNNWEQEYYFYTAVNFGGKYTGRKPLFWKDRKYKTLDWLWLGGVQYAIPYVYGGQSKFKTDRPLGYTGGWLNYIGTGLLYDTRSRETAPRNGTLVELKLKYAPSVLLSDFRMGMGRLDARYYFTFHLLRDVTVVNRILMRHTAGEVPYWELSGLGDEDQMRGFPRNRFLGNSMIVHSLELRTWLLQLDSYSIKFGGQLFMDTGRVFTPGIRVEDIFHGYKHTFGFGGAFSIFRPDFVMRTDLGFSEKDVQIYVGMGYAF